ncbi:MAG: protein translocase subunit SecF [Thermoanaerobaculaceae bacterium]|nr:protein translocase subunit SecF [Thermoanaerobaculaceae bacterium]
MRLFKKTNFPFMKYRWFFVGASLTLVAASVAMVLVGPGLVMGIDFAGGTQLTVKFQEEPDLGRVRAALESLRLGAVSIQRFDEVERHEFLVRLQNPKQEGDFTARMLEALDREFNAATPGVRLNLQGMEAIRDELVMADPDRIGSTVDVRRTHYQPMAEAILALRKERGILASAADLRGLPALSAGVQQYLAEKGRFGAFSLLAADNVGPLVGKDLRNKAMQAVGFSLVGMLVYIWFRFRFAYGIGAVVALFHDVLITLGALSLTGREINLPTIAALLTLVGYSVNDTVVIFDRIRERLKLDRGKSLADTMDLAINQTLSRTVITSGLTLITVVCLYLFGGDVINTFAFVLVVGIVVGTYSSIYIASPIAFAISTVLERRREARRRR